MNAKQLFDKINAEHPELRPQLYESVTGWDGKVNRVTVISTPETKEYLSGLGFDGTPFPRCDFKAA